MEVKSTVEAEQDLPSGGRTSEYEPVAAKYAEIGEDEAIVLRGLKQTDVQNLRNLVYRRFGKKNVIVRSGEKEEGEYIAVVRQREGNEYLRGDE